MNKIILQQAIEQVKTIVAPDANHCQICLKSPWVYSADTVLDIIGTPTAVGLATCKICHENLLIAIGEISMEY